MLRRSPGARRRVLEGDMPPMPAAAILLGDFNFAWDEPEYERVVGPIHAERTRDASGAETKQ